MNNRVYATKFRLELPVNDFESASYYLKEDDMTDILKGHIKSDLQNEDMTEAILPDFADSVKNIEWNLETEDSGEVILIADRDLTGDELHYISEWISGQNSDGLGEGFEQQEFAEIYDEDEYEDEYGEPCEPEYIGMASFDWKTNDYILSDVTKERGQYLQDWEKKQITLSDSDLDFAKDLGTGLEQ